MERIVQPNPAAHKDGFPAVPLRERFGPVPLPSRPDILLADAIADYADAGRPAWNVWSRDGILAMHSRELVIPRTPEFPRGTAFTATANAVWAVPHAGQVLRPRLALALESQDRLAWNALDAHDRAELLRLQAAAARDIVGLSGEQLAEALVYTDESTVRAKVREGRRLLCRLGAWPWCAFRDADGQPPRRWWSAGDTGAQALLAWWICPDLLGWGGAALHALAA